jgi:hypothetical protein
MALWRLTSWKTRIVGLIAGSLKTVRDVVLLTGARVMAGRVTGGAGLGIGVQNLFAGKGFPKMTHPMPDRSQGPDQPRAVHPDASIGPPDATAIPEPRRTQQPWRESQRDPQHSPHRVTGGA